MNYEHLALVADVLEDQEIRDERRYGDRAALRYMVLECPDCDEVINAHLQCHVHSAQEVESEIQ